MTESSTIGACPIFRQFRTEKDLLQIVCTERSVVMSGEVTLWVICGSVLFGRQGRCRC